MIQAPAPAYPVDPPASVPAPPARASLVLITGMSGAGRSAALKALEDIGFEAVDNLPLSFFRWLIRGESGGELGALGPESARAGRALALGIDTRTRGFSAEALLAEVAAARTHALFDTHLLFLDCDDDVLLRRYTETRRRHPLAGAGTVGEGIDRERALLGPVRLAADMVIDTSLFVPGHLKDLLHQRFRPGADAALAVTVMSFSFKLGLPREADLVFDVRFLRNPFYNTDLRPKDGRDAEVAAYVEADPGFDGFFQSLVGLLEPLLPRYRVEGKSYLTIAIGCTGGKHRSVLVCERLAAHIRRLGLPVAVIHRDVERARGAAG